MAGAVITLGSVVAAILWLQRLPELNPVEFGQQVQMTARESTSATIFVSAGLTRAPSCAVTSGNGAPVALGEEQRYLQGDGLESMSGFSVASGTTYTITCTSAGEPGRFAVAQVAPAPVAAFIVAGSVGLALCGAGLAVVLGRRRAQPPAPAELDGP